MLTCNPSSRTAWQTLDRFGDICEQLEKIIRESQVGADKWRRTGMLTIETNGTAIGQAFTFTSAHRKLLEHYGVTKKDLSLSTVKRICVARNKRHRSRTWYTGQLAAVCRRPRKGFDVKFNPDKHYSSAMYCMLDFLQLRHDETRAVIINRDDQAGFRLGSMFTNNKRPTMQVRLTPVCGKGGAICVGGPLSQGL